MSKVLIGQPFRLLYMNSLEYVSINLIYLCLLWPLDGSVLSSTLKGISRRRWNLLADCSDWRIALNMKSGWRLLGVTEAITPPRPFGNHRPVLSPPVTICTCPFVMLNIQQFSRAARKWMCVLFTRAFFKGKCTAVSAYFLILILTCNVLFFFFFEESDMWYRAFTNFEIK